VEDDSTVVSPRATTTDTLRVVNSSRVREANYPVRDRPFIDRATRSEKTPIPKFEWRKLDEPNVDEIALGVFEDLAFVVTVQKILPMIVSENPKSAGSFTIRRPITILLDLRNRRGLTFGRTFLLRRSRSRMFGVRQLSSDFFVRISWNDFADSRSDHGFSCAASPGVSELASIDRCLKA
jgi:hypothetical protein